MPRVTCRCGEKLKVSPESPERMDCPKCGARIRLRRAEPQEKDETGDGYLRFLCLCGRRLKVPATRRSVAGKCPDCGRVVPVPKSAQTTLNSTYARKCGLSDSEARTEELDTDDLAQLEKWAAQHTADPSQSTTLTSKVTGLLTVAASAGPDADAGLLTRSIPAPSAVKFETGLRICPRCRKPVHLSAANCRECGTPIPRQ
jgi:predicted RNA-binding Zn-ribbon protein involved in translation (DUF1610 family)